MSDETVDAHTAKIQAADHPSKEDERTGHRHREPNARYIFYTPAQSIGSILVNGRALAYWKFTI